MLVAVLNTCTKEELEEIDEDVAIMSPTTAAAETAERRKIIKNKIMAVGRMARVFALLRYVRFDVNGCSMVDMCTTVRNLRRSPNSRVYLGLRNFLTVLWHLRLKELGKLSVVSTMRAYFFQWDEPFGLTSCIIS